MPIVLICYGASAVDGFNLLESDREELEQEIENGVRIKDIVNFEGIRDNLLMGYGLAVGLSGTGDNLKNSVFTQQELEGFLSRVGINTRGPTMKTKNTAAAIVTAALPPFIKEW